MENIVRKGEIACNKQFLFFSQYFLPFMVLFFCFICTLKCRLQFVSIWKRLKFCRLVMSQTFYFWSIFLHDQRISLPNDFNSLQKQHNNGLDQTGSICTPCGVRGREVECWPCNHEVPSSSPGSGSQLRDFSLANTFGASTGVVPRKQNRERLV